MGGVTSSPRPGGRSARVGQAVHQAVLDRLEEPDWSRITLGSIAAAAGVNSATLYRRWGSLPQLLGDVMSSLLADTSPLPDRGSLAADVHDYAAKIAADLASPGGLVLLRAAVLIGAEASPQERSSVLASRQAQVEEMLARARARGEGAGSALDFFECVTGPLYGYALFGPGALQYRAAPLADRFLALCAER